MDQDLRPVIEQFLSQSRLPVAIEPGADPIPVSPGHFALSGTAVRPLFECWSDTRTLARRISAIQAQRRGKLELSTEQFGGRKGTLLLVDLAHPASSSATRGGDRLKFREQFRLALPRQYPDWKIVEISTAPTWSIRYPPPIRARYSAREPLQWPPLEPRKTGLILMAL